MPAPDSKGSRRTPARTPRKARAPTAAPKSTIQRGVGSIRRKAKTTIASRATSVTSGAVIGGMAARRSADTAPARSRTGREPNAAAARRADADLAGSRIRRERRAATEPAADADPARIRSRRAPDAAAAPTADTDPAGGRIRRERSAAAEPAADADLARIRSRR